MKVLGQIDSVTPDSALIAAKTSLLRALGLSMFDVDWLGLGAVPYDPAGITDDPVTTSV